MERENNPTLRKLDKSRGEFSYVERKYSIDKNFSFMGTDKIESYNDVAFIFKSLQKASVENAFTLHVLPDGKPLVQHLSMGSPVGTIVHFTSIVDAVKRFNSKRVYFVHNHPSSNINPSNEDFSVLKKVKEVLGDILQEGIIINTISGLYCTFDINQNVHEEKIEEHNSVAKTKIKVLKFDKQIFSENIKQDKIKSAEDAAKLITAQRFNKGDNLSLLILNRSNIVTANIHLPYCNIDTERLFEDINSYTSRFGGTGVIIYGRVKDFNVENKQLKNNIENLKERLNKSEVSLLDFINIKSMPDIDINIDYDKISALSQGIMEKESNYGNKSER